MQKYKLKNGLTLLYEKKPSQSVVVEVFVKTGSNREPTGLGGISHLVEHMLFEGTKKRNSLEIANEIERLGGEINAYTSNERTAFYVKVLGKHIEKALDVLSDVLLNPTFDKKKIEKERRVILKEIDMVTDEPRFHQWILFSKTLFKEHPARNPIYGTRESVSRISRQQLVDYCKERYVANNMIITAVGNLKNPRKKVEKFFSALRKGNLPAKEKAIEPVQNVQQKITEKRKILSSYVVLGYKTCNRTQRESYVLDVMAAILGKGQSGKLFNEIRAKRGLVYDIGVHHESNSDYGFFAAYFSTDKKNIEKIINLILREFSNLKKASTKELKEAKTFIEGEFCIDRDDNFQSADNLSFWEMIKDARLSEKYISEIKKVSQKEVSQVAEKLLNKNYTLAVIEQS